MDEEASDRLIGASDRLVCRAALSPTSITAAH